MKKIACVEMGSNAFRLIIVELKDGWLNQIVKKKGYIKLTDSFDDKMHISEDAMHAGWQYINEFKKIISEYKVDEIISFATYSLRVANNSKEFLQEVEAILGISVEVVCGIKEAEYVYKGANLKFPKGSKLVLDIGGGSTEVVSGKDSNIVKSHSLNLGSLTISQKYFDNGELSPSRFVSAIDFIKSEIKNIGLEINKQENIDYLGCAGTIGALARASKYYSGDGSSIAIDDLYKIREKLIDFGSTEKIDIKQLNGRRNVISGGLCILIAIMESFEINKITLSDFGVREGYIIQNVSTN